jgi:hypothetical protein
MDEPSNKPTGSDLEMLRELHTALISQLLKAVKSGEASPAMMAVARDMLRQNNIQALPTSSADLGQLRDVLATFKPGVKTA